jgi:hypothetical protein
MKNELDICGVGLSNHKDQDLIGFWAVAGGL